MMGHRRDQSESHTPLRQSELQTAVDNHEVRINFSTTSEATLSNGSANQRSSFVNISENTGQTTQTPRSVERRNGRVSFLFVRIYALRKECSSVRFVRRYFDK